MAAVVAWRSSTPRSNRPGSAGWRRPGYRVVSRAARSHPFPEIVASVTTWRGSSAHGIDGGAWFWVVGTAVLPETQSCKDQMGKRELTILRESVDLSVSGHWEKMVPSRLSQLRPFIRDSLLSIV